MKHSNNIFLSVVLATFNEEKNLPRCLKAVQGWADEIVVVDGSSTDKTRHIAKKYQARVFKTSNKPIFHINKQTALDKARGDWILQLDADEVVTKKLRQEIDEVLHSAVHAKRRTLSSSRQKADTQQFTPKGGQATTNGYWIPRKNYFLGKWLRKGGQYPDYVIRLVKKGKAHFPCKSVHEQIEIQGKVDYLQNPLDHFSTPTVARYWVNANRYTSLTAAELLENPKLKPSLLTFLNFVIYKPLKTFLLIYLRHKGFMDGAPGFLFALFSALHWPIAFFKYWEMKREH